MKRAAYPAMTLQYWVETSNQKAFVATSKLSRSLILKKKKEIVQELLKCSDAFEFWDPIFNLCLIIKLLKEPIIIYTHVLVYKDKNIISYTQDKIIQYYLVFKIYFKLTTRFMPCLAWL